MISVMGLGFVGLTTALGFCEQGLKVYGYDTDRNKAERLRRGTVPFHEPVLANKLQEHLSAGTFQLAEDAGTAIRESQFIFFCVGTPCGADGEADLNDLTRALQTVLSSLEKDGRYRVLAIKSTVPPATVRDTVRPLVERAGWTPGKDIGLAANPEFLREGRAWQDVLHPDRIVIGAEDGRSAELLAALYRPFKAPVCRVSSETAEYIKYLSNTMLAAMISFANEQAMIAGRIGGIDVKTAFHILHLDKRWTGAPADMASYVYPGCGFGGYCLPKDTLALAVKMEKSGFRPPILSAVLKVNGMIKEAAADEIARAAGPGNTIGILGLAFKPGSDDVRESPAKGIIEHLLDRGLTRLTVYDPLAMNAFRALYNLPVAYADSLESCVENSSLLVLLTAWDEFVEKRELLLRKQVLDFRYVL